MTAYNRSRRCLLILLDGLADRSYPELAGRTPLEAAATPNLDRLAAGGACGLYHALSPGVALSSEAAHFFMLGYPPALFPGRGLLEALGLGLTPQPGEVFLMFHLAVLEPQGRHLMVVRRRPPLPEDQALELIAAVGRYNSPQGTVSLVREKGVSGVVRLSGQFSPRITDSDPLAEGHPLIQVEPWQQAGQEQLDPDPAAARAAELLSAYLAWAHYTLQAHPINQRRLSEGLAPVNGVITQRAGAPTAVEPVEQRLGLKIKTLASAPIYTGLFTYLGASASLVAPVDDPAREMAHKLPLALSDLESFDLVHLHSKAPDEAAHTKDPGAKVRAIEALDRGLSDLPQELASRPELLLVVTGDHATPSGGPLIHSGECSPLLMAGPGIWRDGVETWHEAACGAGALGLLRGPELMQLILSHLERARLWGLRDHSLDLPYWPGPARPFTLEKT